MNDKIGFRALLGNQKTDTTVSGKPDKKFIKKKKKPQTKKPQHTPIANSWIILSDQTLVTLMGIFCVDKAKG